MEGGLSKVVGGRVLTPQTCGRWELDWHPKQMGDGRQRPPCVNCSNISTNHSNVYLNGHSCFKISC